MAAVEPLIDAKQAAKLLRVSAEHLRRLCRLHQIPHVRVGYRVLFRPSTLNAWMSRQELESCPPLAAKEGA